MEVKMAHKQIKTVHLKRQPHRDAKRRLHLAYAYLIDKDRQSVERLAAEKEIKQQPQEAKS